MPSRRKRIQGVGALIGQSAAHGALYGELQRERVLYEGQARDELEEIGRLNDNEWKDLKAVALTRGMRQIREAVPKGKVPPEVGDRAIARLAEEIDRLLEGIGGLGA
jgi:hypothetical protein